MLNLEKEKYALWVIDTALKKYGHKVFCGYSGGKDSKVVLHLARSIEPNIIAVHSQHENEKCDLKSGVVIVKSPKENFKELMKYADLEVQLDGTNWFEDDKKVIYDKVEIERKDIPHEYNPYGVFGLKVYYPILSWKVDEVWAYIRKYKIMSEEEIKNYVPSHPYREIYL